MSSRSCPLLQLSSIRFWPRSARVSQLSSWGRFRGEWRMKKKLRCRKRMRLLKVEKRNQFKNRDAKKGFLISIFVNTQLFLGFFVKCSSYSLVKREKSLGNIFTWETLQIDIGKEKMPDTKSQGRQIAYKVIWIGFLLYYMRESSIWSKSNKYHSSSLSIFFSWPLQIRLSWRPHVIPFM